MKPFKTIKEAIAWANTSRPIAWIDVVVRVGQRVYRLETTHIAYLDELVTRATEVYRSSENAAADREFRKAFTPNKYGEYA